MKQIILTNSKYSNFCSVSNNQRSNSEFKNDEEIVLNTKGNDIFGNKSSNYGIKDGKEFKKKGVIFRLFYLKVVIIGNEAYLLK